MEFRGSLRTFVVLVLIFGTMVSNQSVATTSGSQLREALTTTPSNGTGTISLLDISDFSPRGGSGILAPDTGREEQFSYGAIDLNSNVLVEVTRPGAFAHDAGTQVVALAEPDQSPTPGAPSPSPTGPSAAEQEPEGPQATPTPSVPKPESTASPETSQESTAVYSANADVLDTIAVTLLFDHPYLEGPSGACGYVGFTAYNARLAPVIGNPEYALTIAGPEGPETRSGWLDNAGRAVIYHCATSGTYTFQAVVQVASGSAVRYFPGGVEPIEDSQPVMVLFDDTFLHGRAPVCGNLGFTTYASDLGRASGGIRYNVLIAGSNGIQMFSGTTDSAGRGLIPHCAASAGVDAFVVTMATASGLALRSFDSALIEELPISIEEINELLEYCGSSACSGYTEFDFLNLLLDLTFEVSCPAPRTGLACVDQGSFMDGNGDGIADGWKSDGFQDFPGCNPNPPGTYHCPPDYTYRVTSEIQRMQIYNGASAGRPDNPKEKADVGILRTFEAQRDEQYSAYAEVRISEDAEMVGNPGFRARLTIVARKANGKQIGSECNDVLSSKTVNYVRVEVTCRLPDNAKVAAVSVKVRAHVDDDGPQAGTVSCRRVYLRRIA